MESSFFSFRTRRGYINRRPCPRVRPRGHTTQRARGEIFKLSLLKRKVETQTYGWRGDMKDDHESRGCGGRMLLIGDGATVASCPMRLGGGFLPDAERRWLLARCCAAVAACPMRRGGGVLPDAARRWRLARCCAAVASCGSGFLPDAARRWRLAR